MLAKLIYIIGVVLAIWCVLDIFKHNKLSLLMKILLSIAVLAFSWLGFAVYYFLIRNKI
ncbi:MAG: SurA N-terminal domain-containing protein [Bacteroidales bacterium]|nr:SurA N-terminal domain-containing protein [Bacteroidales bacterium]